MKFWWMLHREKAGLVIAGAVILAISLAAFAYRGPGGNPLDYAGLVTGFSTLSSERGTDLYARVYVDRRTTAVLVDAHNGCAVGDHIPLQKLRFAGGEMFVARRGGCIPAPAKR